jgi:branched-chain amino acid transport system ATP-binding protein
VSTSARKGGLFARSGRDGQIPILSVSSLSAYYGELRALHDIGFDVNPGEVLAIIGANGAGKTTLLKSIVGMMNRGKTAHITGTIDFHGRRLDRLTTEKIVATGVTMVPEGRMLFSRMTVTENLLIGAYLPQAQANGKRRVAEMFELFPRLGERRDQVVSQMSGGEQQMVAIARALMSEPSLVLFDELSLGLAPIIVDDIYEKVNEINRTGVTCVVIEQDTSRALAVSNHVLVMLEGRVVLEGAPARLSKAEITDAYFGTRQTIAGTNV